MKYLLIGLIRIYQIAFSPLKILAGGPCCRFSPSCSQYAIEALREHGTFSGGFLAVRRLCRCHPWGGFGLDPVPPKSEPQMICRRS